MKKELLFSIFVFLLFNAKAQNVGIGTNTPHANAILEVNSTNKGLLLPRVADTNAIAGAKPAGLTIYSNSDGKLYFYNGTKWQSSAAAASGSADSLWQLKNDSINHTNKKYVSINTDYNLAPPQATLQVNGSLLVQQPVSYSTSTPGAGQTFTMQNNTILTTIASDSVARIFEHGGSGGNYLNNLIGTVKIMSAATNGLKGTFNNTDFGIAAGDTLWVSYYGFPACRTNYLQRYTTTTTTPPPFFTPSSVADIFLVFSTDGATVDKGFDISITKIYNPSETPVNPYTLGNQLYFNPVNGSLVSGYKLNTPGIYSISTGLSDASGSYAVAMGSSRATGITSTALGYSTASNFTASALGSSTASGEFASALGSSTASGNYATAFGASHASGPSSTAMGFSSVASATNATAMGQSTASGYNSTAMGFSLASNTFSTSMGFSQSKGVYATSTGLNTIANGYGGLVTGMYNDTIVAVQNGPSSNTPLFIIGNGSNPSSRSNALSVLYNGNTGIGNVVPQTTLHVKSLNNEVARMQGPSGYITFYDNNNYLGYLQAAGTTMSLGADGAINKLGLFTNFNERLTILPSGNVGINEQNPAVKFHVTSAIGEVARIQGPGGYMTFYDDNNFLGYNQAIGNLFAVGANGGATRLALYTNGLERLTALPNGNTGINTNNPQAAFHVNGAATEAIRVEGPNAAQTFYNGNGYIGYLQAFNNTMSLASQGANKLGLFTSFTERLTVLPNGNVGIGQAAPNYKFDVAGDVNFTGLLRANGSAGLAGQTLTSNGAGAPTWVNPTNSVYNSAVRRATAVPSTSIPFVTVTDIPDLTYTFTVTENNLLVINANIALRFPSCFACGKGLVVLYLIIDGVTVTQVSQEFDNDNYEAMHSSWFTAIGPGTHTVKYAISHHNSTSGNPQVYGNGGGFGGLVNPTNMNIMFFKQ